MKPVRPLPLRLTIRACAGTWGGLALLLTALLSGLPGVNDLPFWLVTGLVVFALLPPRTSMLLSSSILASALLLAGLVSWAGPAMGLDQALFPNPVVRLIRYDFLRGHQIFAPRTDAELTIPMGDLQAMTTRDLHGAPKTVRFVTDSLGYRNESDYAGRPLALVGDSFVVSSSSDQADIPASVLRRDHGLEAYAVAAVGGDMADYARWTRDFFTRFTTQARVVLVCFEGNDFDPVEDRDRLEPAWKLWTRRTRDWFRFQPLGRTVFTQVGRLKARERTDPVVTATAGGHPLAFYRPYVEQVLQPQPRDLEDFPALLAEMAPRTAAVFFVPAKFRVYAPLLDKPLPELLSDADTQGLPHAQWDYLASLCAQNGLPCFDLTPALAAEARKALDQGRFVYFPDDTHWNARGIRAAMAAVAKALDGKAANDAGDDATASEPPGDGS